MHRSYEAIERAWRDRPPSPSDAGTLRRIVARAGDQVHRVLEHGALTIADGLVGDRWTLPDDPTRASQLTLIEWRVLAALGDLAHPGDNLIVDLDLSEAALPAGTRLRIGSALIAITDEPHTGCGRFAKRFGVDALKWVNARDRRALRLRGVHARVVEDGLVAPGDPIATC